MDKKEYIRRQIARTNKKNYENYVITRIIHKIDNLDVKFTTQQYVKRPNSHALADLFFPQLNYFIEIDEGHHLNQVELDKARDADFEDVTGSVPARVDVVNNTIEQINIRIDEVVTEIRTLIEEKKKSGLFVPWDLNKEMNSDTWIEKGSIHLNDKVAFRRIVDGCKCFGLDYAGYQRAGAVHPYETGTFIWFPKLYPNGVWDNSIDESENIIIERNIESVEKRKVHVDSCVNAHSQKRIVFARVRGVLGDILYRFKGVFILDKEATNSERGVVWVKVSDEAKTYNYRN